MSIEDYLKTELDELSEEFQKMFPKYGDSWRTTTIGWLLKRLFGEYRELRESYRDGKDLREVREEAIDCALVSLMIAERCYAVLNTGEERD